MGECRGLATDAKAAAAAAASATAAAKPAPAAAAADGKMARIVAQLQVQFWSGLVRRGLTNPRTLPASLAAAARWRCECSSHGHRCPVGCKKICGVQTTSLDSSIGVCVTARQGAKAEVLNERKRRVRAEQRVEAAEAAPAGVVQLAVDETVILLTLPLHPCRYTCQYYRERGGGGAQRCDRFVNG